MIKSAFSRAIEPGERISARRKIKSERGIWQRCFWEHAIRDQCDFDRDLDYIHYNPVKHGLVERVSEWPYSSFHRFVRLGYYPLNWAASIGLDGFDWENLKAGLDTPYSLSNDLKMSGDTYPMPLTFLYLNLLFWLCALFLEISVYKSVP